METCHNLPNTDVDEVSKALSLCKDRIIVQNICMVIMGDECCHPRDNIALSWLANKLNLSFNWYEILCPKENFRQNGWQS